MHMTMKMLFLRRIPSENGLGSDIISLSYVLRLWIELIKYINENAMKKFHWLEVFGKLTFLVEISKISKILKI